jgi:hypothetical protein
MMSRSYFGMKTQSPEISTELLCHECGYDVRAQPTDGKCPECGASVLESRRLSSIPRRPAWRDSDLRWRRRMLAGVWVLTLMPLMDTLKGFGWASSIPIPTFYKYWGPLRLEETLVSWPGVYQPLVFCIGVVLLFSKERNRRRSKLDWTRRWGVLCSYVVMLLSAAPVLDIGALVLTGIAALLQSMPLKYQPGITSLLVKISTGYMLHGPQPNYLAGAVLVAFSSIAILLACVALFDALSGSGSKRLAIILLAPLALFALVHLFQSVQVPLFGYSSLSSGTAEVLNYEVYFWPSALLAPIPGVPSNPYYSPSSPPPLSASLVEAVKWCIVLAIAVWLSIAQFAARKTARATCSSDRAGMIPPHDDCPSHFSAGS